MPRQTSHPLEWTARLLDIFYIIRVFLIYVSIFLLCEIELLISIDEIALAPNMLRITPE